MQRLAVLYSRLSGYMAACLRTLRERYGVSLLVITVPPSNHAPFDDRHFNWIGRLYNRRTVNGDQIRSLLEDFKPDAVFVSGWFDRAYLQVARRMRKQGVPVIAGCDAQWKGTWRQQVGRVIAPWYLHSAIDILWVAGERQRTFAHLLGYRGPRCWSGVYACDWDRFACNDYLRNEDPEPCFLFVGRYIEEKGIDTLAAAYRRYRKMAHEPWPLVCAGSGPMEYMLQGSEGIVNKGFVQPDNVPALMKEAATFVLPSRHEPWGVVVQEAAAAGLPLICSDASGAAVHLLQDGYNGWRMQPENANQLSDVLLRMSTISWERRKAMGERSYELSKQFQPDRWSRTIFEGVRSFRRETQR